MQDNQRQHSGIETARRIVSAARIAKAAAAGGVHGAAVAAAKEAAPFLAKLAIWVLVALIALPMLIFAYLPNIFFGFSSSGTASVARMTGQAMTLGGFYMDLEDFENTQIDAIVTSLIQQYEEEGILDHIVQQDDYPTLKNICEGRSLPAYEAAAEFTDRAAEELDGLLSELGGDKGALNTLEKLETARDAAAEGLAKLLDAQAKGETTEPDKQALINAANRLDSKQRQVEAVSQVLDTTMLRQTDTVDLAVSAAVQAATERAQEVQSIIGAWSDEPSNMRCTPENLALLEKVRKSTTLKDISKYMGRFREIFAQAKNNSYAYGRGETYSLELGNNLSRALTSELAMLATPETIPLFLRKYQQRQIKQYRRREPIYKGMGDIICCLDESGSTEGEAAAWGKAVAMTLLEIAAESRRSFALIHFAGSGSCQVDIFRPGEYTLEDKLSAAETFLGGGTNFERPICEAIRLMEMEEEDFEKADVVFITDGECELPDACRQELQSAQAAYHFTVCKRRLGAVISGAVMLRLSKPRGNADVLSGGSAGDALPPL